MKHKVFKHSLFVLIAIGLIVQSCIKKEDYDLSNLSTDLISNPTVAVPLVNSKLTLRDIVRDYDENELFEEDQTGMLYLMYRKRIFSQTAKDIVKIPTQNISNSYLAPSAIDLNSATYSYTNSTVEDFSVNNSSRLETINLKSAQLTISITSSQTLNGTVEIKFPSITKGGVAYSKVIDLSVGGGTYNDLNDYKVDLTTESPNYNKLPIDYIISLNNSNASFNTGDEMFAATVKLDSVEYKSILGFIGQDVINVPKDSVHVDIFDKAFDGDIYFMDPKFKVNINNSFGIPMKFEFDSFKTYNAVGSYYKEYQFPIVYNPLNIASPTQSEMGVVKSTNFIMDTVTFPEIRTMVADNPKYILFGVHGYINPVDPGTNDDFVLDTSRFDVDLQVELPLWGHAKYFVLQDTFDLDFSDFYEDVDSLEYALFRVNADNFMPVDVSVQVYFVDSNFAMVDSLYSDGEIRFLTSGITNGAGKVVQSTNKLSDFKFTDDRLKRLQDVKYVFTRGYINTTDEATKEVRFYGDNYIRIKMGMQAQGFVNAKF